MIKLILVISLAIFLSIPKFTLACKCLAADFVDTLCHADFVSHVKVDFKERYIGNGGHEKFGHQVEHIEHFKDGDWPSIITTSGRDSICGVNLTMGYEYLISGKLPKLWIKTVSVNSAQLAQRPIEKQLNRRNCAHCDGRHNRAICLTPNGETGKPREEKQKSTNNVGEPVDQTLSNSAVSEWKQEVFLMAKEATIGSPTRRTEVRAIVFFDNGSQISYITKALANKLKLRKIRDSELEVQTFNQDTPMRMKSAVHAVHIQQNDGSMREVIVHSTDKISASLRTASWEGNESQPPSNIDALVPKDAQEPDVLIGMADFWKFLQKVERLSESMYLIHSTLGPILCGRAQMNTLQKEKVSSHAIVVNTLFQSEPNDENSERFRNLEGIGVSEDPEQDDEKVAVK
ncbi:putative peptidase (DUF1758) domain-containing protein [Ditylenchus destructor]|uniref:Peptidase (DUF1758) domain-containing protein n=1 Tax=Ditylenchus destructor TaxID=166010 RepID=A0AAD4MKX9_9BILA|nr:putative peptidase (DUF1758) domain-containing protein [Ditylenchus destructor]